MEPPPPPQPTIPATTIPNNAAIIRALRRLDGTPRRHVSASTPPPLNVFHSWLPGESKRLLLEAAVVFTVTTVEAVPPVAMVMLAGFRVQLGRLCAPAGEAESVQVTFIVPE